MEKETDTDKILRALAGVHARVDELGEATKHDLTALKTEMVEFVAGEFAKLRTEDIEPMKPRHRQPETGRRQSLECFCAAA